MFPYLDLLYIYIIYLLKRRIYTENIQQIILHGIRAGYLFFFGNPKNLAFLCSLGFRRHQASSVPFSYHQASPVVISDLIGSPGFAGDHLGFLSHRIGSPGIAGDQLGISDLIVLPGLPLVALGLDLLGLLSIFSRRQWLLVLISSVCSRSTTLDYSQACLGPRSWLSHAAANTLLSQISLGTTVNLGYQFFFISCGHVHLGNSHSFLVLLASFFW